MTEGPLQSKGFLKVVRVDVRISQLLCFHNRVTLDSGDRTPGCFVVIRYATSMKIAPFFAARTPPPVFRRLHGAPFRVPESFFSSHGARPRVANSYVFTHGAPHRVPKSYVFTIGSPPGMRQVSEVLKVVSGLCESMSEFRRSS